jgi:hypothetical protein
MNTRNEDDTQDIQTLIVDLLTRQTKILEQLARPYVIVDLYPRRYVNMLYFRVRNVGQTPAFNIRMIAEPPISIMGRLSSELNIFQKPIGVLGKGEEISFFFGSAVELMSEEEPTLQFEVKLEYVDSDGNQYKQVLPVSIDLLRNLSLELPAADKMLEQLERIKRETEKIARYADRLRHQDIVRAYQESQEQTEEPIEEGDLEDNGE